MKKFKISKNDQMIFENLLTNKLPCIFKNFLHKYDNNEEVVGIGLTTDESLMSIGASANTKDYLSFLSKKHPNEKNYYKWTPGEWRYEDLMDVLEKDYLKEINKMLLDWSSIDFTEEEFEYYRNWIFDIVIKNLVDIKNNDFLGADLIIIFTVTDSFDVVEARSVCLLNSPDNVKEYRLWIDEEEDNRVPIRYPHWLHPRFY